MRVAVLGAGYAGVAAARRLERTLPAGTDLVVVDANDYHLLAHEIHRLVRYPALADVVRIPLTEVLADSTTVRQAHVRTVDPAAGVATLEDGELEYDVGIVCLGTAPDFSDLPGIEAHATPLKRLADAARIRRDFLDALPDARVVVGGAGLSGIQIAGELAAFARDRSTGADVRLLEQHDSVAPGFPSRFQEAVRSELETRGVTVRTNAVVERADADAVVLDAGGRGDVEGVESGDVEGVESDDVEAGGGEATGERVPYDQFVWTGGIRGPAALGGDRPEVPSTLRLEGPTFAIGDAARVIDADGEVVPASAQAAVREGRVAADNVLTLVEHHIDGSPVEPRLRRFRFAALGWVVSVGDGAVAKLGPTVLRGRAATAAKASVDASYLGGLRAVGKAASLVREEIGW